MIPFTRDTRSSPLARQIPSWAYVLTVAVWIAIQLLMHWGFRLERNPPPVAFQLGFALYIATVFSPLVLLAGLVNADARQRGMSSPFWTALALFPPGVGIALYFLFRMPKLLDCRRCGTKVRPGSAYCTSCGQAMGSLCPHCQREVHADDSFCPHCGRELGTQ